MYPAQPRTLSTDIYHGNPFRLRYARLWEDKKEDKINRSFIDQHKDIWPSYFPNFAASLQLKIHGN